MFKKYIFATGINPELQSIELDTVLHYFICDVYYLFSTQSSNVLLCAISTCEI